VIGEPPIEVTAYLARRRALDQDRLDEIWEGEYHVVPAPHPWHGIVHSALHRLLGPYADDAGLVATSEFNVGEPGDFRVPDGGYHRTVPSDVYVPTAAIVVEVLSPDDETWAKLGFYARHHVDEICVVDPQQHTITWFTLQGAEYSESPGSSLLGVSSGDLVARIDWPG
jgi:Uma2 family endonuclease